MGWLFHPVEAARYHDKNAEIDRIFTPADPKYVTFTIVQRSWHGSTCYVACRIQNTHPDTPRDETIGFVILTKSYMENGQRWWGYKDMDEGMLPYHSRAPKSLIAKLSPTTNENALKWREACLAYTAPKKLKRFRTKEPVSFDRHGFTAQEFERVEMKGYRGVYKALDYHNTIVRLQSWRLEGATPL